MTAGVTPRQLLDDACARLDAAGVASARADAEWLLCHVLRVGRGRLPLLDGVDEASVERFDDLLAARCRRVPLQHLTGTAPFGPVDLAVGPGVFVPRPETELLLEWALQRIGDCQGPVRAADFCSGSGALAIALATSDPRVSLDALEMSESALGWLRRNVVAADLGDRIRVHAADVTDAGAVAAAVGGAVDLVVSNPPYVPSATPVEPEVRADPAEAVFGGADGMAVITPMVSVIAAVLRPGGWVGIEHDDDTAPAVVAALEDVRLSGARAFDEVRSHLDLAGRPRFVTARRIGTRATALSQASGV